MTNTKIIQSVYIGKQITDVIVDDYSSTGKAYIYLHYDWNGQLEREILTLKAGDDTNPAHQYNCDFDMLNEKYSSLIGKYIHSITVKRVKDGFLFIFNYTKDAQTDSLKGKGFDYKKIFIPAYSCYDTYYSSDVSLAIYKDQELVIESLAENDGDEFNSELDNLDYK